MIILTILMILFQICNTIGCEKHKLVVTTVSGKIEGSTLTSRLGKTIYSFRGIRYAQPPVGELRFQPPVPVEPWEGVYDATDDGPLCPQPGNVGTKSEDCLVVNVYSTKLPNSTYNCKRPVIFFIHPGGYYSVGSASYWLGPQYFMDQDIVLVTINYRLGSLGLFHKVIAMSYSPLGALPIGTKQLALAKKQARLVGCPDDTVQNIIGCLKNVSYIDLGNSLEGFSEFGYDPIMIWTPVIEKDFGQERYLTDHPINLVLSGQFMNVPVITGITEYEFGYRAYEILGNVTLTNEMNADWQKVAPIAFCYERNTDFSTNVSNTLKKHYLLDQAVSNSTLNELNNLYADAIIGFSVNRAAKLLSQYSTQPVYYYLFSYHGNYSHFNLEGSNHTIGAVHHDELIYLFYIQKIFPLFGISSPPEIEMVSKLTKMWTNFAKNGQPIPSNNGEFSNVKWSPFTRRDQIYLNIGNILTEKRRLFDNRYSIWESLFPLDAYKNLNYAKEYYE